MSFKDEVNVVAEVYSFTIWQSEQVVIIEDGVK
jgi:hypothetical protein